MDSCLPVCPRIQKIDYMRLRAYYISLININFWIPACQSVREQEKMDYMRFNA